MAVQPLLFTKPDTGLLRRLFALPSYGKLFLVLATIFFTLRYATFEVLQDCRANANVSSILLLASHLIEEGNCFFRLIWIIFWNKDCTKRI